MSQANAPKESERVTKAMDREDRGWKPLEPTAGAKEQAKRQGALIERWLVTELGHKQFVYDNEAAATADLSPKIEARFNEFYGMT